MHGTHLMSCVRLVRTPGIGAMTAQKLIASHNGVEGALDFLISTHAHVYTAEQAKRDIEAHAQLGAHLISFDDNRYPALLKQIHGYPLLLSVLGNPRMLNHSCLSIVGARHAAMHSLSFTQTLSSQLTDYGYTVVSGLARGIDGAAHKGALLQQKKARTIAVVAGGVDTLYPREHAKLRHDILELEGAIVSEMPLGVFPGASHFPRRNRIISGLSKALCVIEASKNSGSMITARFALEQGRDVFAVPGFPMQERCGGSNQLLREGAYFLENVHDIIHHMGDARHDAQDTFTASHDAQEGEAHTTETDNVTSHILALLGEGALSFDDIVMHLDMDHTALHTVILSLEMQGLILRDMRGFFVRTPSA